MVTAKKTRRDWRRFLTDEERAVIVASDNLAAAIEQMKANYERTYTRERALIVNRCCQRAKAAKLQSESTHG